MASLLDTRPLLLPHVRRRAFLRPGSGLMVAVEQGLTCQSPTIAFPSAAVLPRRHRCRLIGVRISARLRRDAERRARAGHHTGALVAATA